MSNFLEEMERCIPALRRYARVLQHNKNDADDLVQDCLELALRKRHLWMNNSSMRAWLFTLLHNVYVSQLRRLSKCPCRGSTEHIVPISRDSSQVELLMRDTMKCFNQLHPNQQQVLLLVVVEGFTYDEVSKIVNIPIGTVMSRLSRAREKMRVLIEGK